MGVAGIWYNELGSRMTIEIQPDGSLSGSYASGVGSSGTMPLSGRYDPTYSPGNGGQNCGWVVEWNSGPRAVDRLTSWSGQYFPGFNTIVAMWHMTAETTTQGQWESTFDGKDVFYSAQRTDEQIAEARVHVAPSHPHRE